MRRPDAPWLPSDKSLTGAALIVQNNIMTALEIEALLQDRGVETCFLAATVETALQALASSDIAFAVIDTNLGQATSEAVATALLERQLPFIFTTNFDDHIDLTKHFPGAPVLAKPLRETLLYQALATLGVM
jgi:DNA-binding NarL/FixJ family response regulator